jgi:hypothetical protein
MIHITIVLWVQLINTNFWWLRNLMLIRSLSPFVLNWSKHCPTVWIGNWTSTIHRFFSLRRMMKQSKLDAKRIEPMASNVLQCATLMFCHRAIYLSISIVHDKWWDHYYDECLTQLIQLTTNVENSEIHREVSNDHSKQMKFMLWRKDNLNQLFPALTVKSGLKHSGLSSFKKCSDRASIWFIRLIWSRLALLCLKLRYRTIVYFTRLHFTLLYFTSPFFALIEVNGCALSWIGLDKIWSKRRLYGFI